MKKAKLFAACAWGALCIAGPSTGWAGTDPRMYGQTLEWRAIPTAAYGQGAANAAGQVVGSPANGLAIVEPSGAITNIPTPHYPATYGIGASGAVVGDMREYPPDQVVLYNSFVYQNGQTTTLPGVQSPYGSIASTVSDDGRLVAGWQTTFQNNQYVNKAFLYSNGQISNIAGLGAVGAVNNLGQVGGSNALGQAVLAKNGSLTVMAENAIVSDLNNVGQAVGTLRVDELAKQYQHAYVYSQGVRTQLDLVDSDYTQSKAISINDHGQVLGRAWTQDWGPRGLETTADTYFLYSGGKTFDLSAAVLGLGEMQTIALDESGNLYGVAYRDGTSNFFRVALLPVPEPSTFMLMGLGFAGLLTLRGRGQRGG
jgi:probable HAF family extracellular repeat protein